MTLAEMKALANGGDIHAIMALGNYYYSEDAKKENHQDINEAIHWYCMGAELGDGTAMQLAAILLSIKARACLGALGTSGAAEAADLCKQALYWNDHATEQKHGISEKLKNDTVGTLGKALYLKSLNEEDDTRIHTLKEAVQHLRSIYNRQTSVEYKEYLAFAMDSLAQEPGHCTMEDSRLEHQLLQECVDLHFDELEHGDLCLFYLGLQYIEGIGCRVDYDMAYDYLTKAHHAGFDCSDLLCRFKKKLFGGYKYE